MSNWKENGTRSPPMPTSQERIGIIVVSPGCRGDLAMDQSKLSAATDVNQRGSGDQSQVR